MSLTVIDLPDNCMHAGNEISCVIETSLPTSTVNLEIVCGLVVELVYGSTTFEILVTLTLKPDQNRQCKFFLNKYLWDAFENQIDIPNFQSTSASLLQNAVRKYKLFAVENSGNPSAPTDMLLSGPIADQRYAVKGAIAEARFAHRKFFGSGGWLSLSAGSGGLGNAFLDWRGQKPRTRLNEDQWLHLHWQDPFGTVGAAALEYKCSWKRSDETTGTFTVLTTPVVQLHEVYALPAGFGQLNLSSYETPEHKITSYQTWISVDILGNPVIQSEVKNWQVDRDYYEFTQQLQYINSLGVMEQITLRGAQTKNFTIEKDRVESYRDNSYANTEGESTVFDVVVLNGSVAITGAGTAQEAKQFADLKASHRVFIVPENTGQVNIPVQIKGGKHAIDPLKNTFTYSLEIQQDFQDSVPDLIG